MPSKPPPRAKGPVKPPRPRMPTIDVDVDWLESPTEEPGKAAPKGAAPVAEAPRRDTIPVQPEWLEVDEEPPAPPAPKRVPRPPAKTAKKSSSPPKRSR